ncbi:MAG: HD domain-containing protein [Treponema sp.]|nr:HD domain-containing protein [Treponema sp.]
MADLNTSLDLADTFDELEPLDVLDLNEEEPDVTSLVSQEVRSKAYVAAASPYLNSSFPVVIIDKEMKIIFTNVACKTLFAGFLDFAGTYFMDVFARSFGIDDMRKIHSVIIGGEDGSFWKGEVTIKSRTIVSIQIKVYIFPAELRSREPSEFIIMFDDITEEKKLQMRGIFLSLLEASKLKDNDTGNHIVRVNQYSKRIAEELFQCSNHKYNRIDADFIENIGFLAAMHDVGKIGTPDDILNKKEQLSDWEWGIMREHTKNGAFILSSYPHPMAKEIALSHHERWDGTGYPYQLSGEMIPLAARIVTLADVYDALRMERSYKPSLPHDVAVEKMLAAKGSHFDPFLVEVFLPIAGDFDRIYENTK